MRSAATGHQRAAHWLRSRNTGGPGCSTRPEDGVRRRPARRAARMRRCQELRSKAERLVDSRAWLGDQVPSTRIGPIASATTSSSARAPRSRSKRARASPRSSRSATPRTRSARLPARSGFSPALNNAALVGRICCLHRRQPGSGVRRVPLGAREVGPAPHREVSGPIASRASGSGSISMRIRAPAAGA